ncbi:MAG: alpha-L-glutamate ligase-like protein [Pseudomonadales bacterium]|nr:alpha-L-glutamate ligase-like protein [Pseudomonadales bacterium]
MLCSPGILKDKGVLSINRRNSDFIMRYNPRRLFPLVDDKLKTKELALQHGIAVPKLLGIIEIYHQIKQLAPFLETLDDFVIKPSHGSGGSGILVVTGRSGKNFCKAGGDLIDFDHVAHHVSNILSGMYSLGGRNDHAIVEYRVKFDPFFAAISYQGVPDIRVIVFKGIPVAAMLRLPTRESQGKANLHQGAMGVGIDIATGKSCGGVYRDKICKVHPDTGESTEMIEMPHWSKIIELAMKCADTVGLGYLGVDIVLDQDLGPLMLELNARPGLNVQIANGVGLLKMLDQVESLKEVPSSLQERANLAVELAQKLD